jgi:hypothetical protein
LGEVDRVLLEAFDEYPEAVLEWIAQLPPPAGRERWLATVLKSFPPGALPAISAWVARLPADHFRVVAVSAAVKQWAALDLEGAQAAARSCEGLGDFAWVRRPLLEDVDAEGQAAFVRTLSPQGQADFWSEAQVGMPAGLVAAEMVRALDRPALERTAQKLFSDKARTNPLQALAAAQTLPDDGLRDAMCRTVVQHWSAEDSHLASQYAAALPAGALRDAAAEGLAIDLATVDAEAAARWAASIADAERRRATEARLAEAKPGPGAPPPAAGSATETRGQP